MSSPQPSLILDDPPRSAWVVPFAWSNDRYGHSIAWRDPEGIVHPLLASIEGFAAQDVFPPSPPLQQLHLQQIGGRPAALGVGMSGQPHWSVAVTLSETSTDTLVLEYAASRRGATGQPSCTWRIDAGLDVRKEDRRLFLASNLSGHRWVIELEGVDRSTFAPNVPAPEATRNGPIRESALSGGLWAIFPRIDGLIAEPLRWAVRLRQLGKSGPPG